LKTLRESAWSSVFWAAIEQFSERGLGFIFSIILARILLPEDFGLIAVVAIFIKLGSLIVSSGMTSSIIRSKDLNQSDYSTVFYFNILMAGLIYGIIFFLAKPIANFYNNPLLVDLTRILSLTILLQSFSSMQYTLFMKQMNFRKLTFIGIPSLFTGALVGVWMAYNEYGVWSLVGQSIVTALLRLALLWTRNSWKPQAIFDLVVLRRHFYFGINLSAAGMINAIFNEIYVVVIGRFFNMAQVGFYQRSLSMSRIPSRTLALIVHKVSFPLLSKIQDKEVQLKSIYKKIFQMVIFIIAPIMIYFGVVAEPLFRFILTEKWLPAVPYFQILVMPAILYPIQAFNMEIVIVKGKSNLFLKAQIINKIFLVIAVLLTFPYGILGLLYGSVVVSILAVIINIYYAAPLIDYGYKEQFLDLLPTALLAISMGLLVWISNKLLLEADLSNLTRLAITFSVAFAFYSIAAYIFKFKALDEIQQLIKIKR